MSRDSLINILLPKNEFYQISNYYTGKATLSKKINIYNLEIYYFYDYSKVIKNLFHRIKINKEFNIIKELTLKITPEIEFLKNKIDLIVYTPPDEIRLLKRGFNTPEIIANIIAKNLEIPIKTIFKKPTSSPPQSTLSKTERCKISSSKFTVHPNFHPEKYSNILIIDDISTTGATLNQLKKLLGDKSNISSLVLVSA